MGVTDRMQADDVLLEPSNSKDNQTGHHGMSAQDMDHGDDDDNRKILFLYEGYRVTLEDFTNVCCGNTYIQVHPELKELIQASRAQLEERIENGDVMYGISTGFGSLRDRVIAPKDLDTLQTNLVRSHACGVGETVDCAIAIGMMFLRVVSFARCNSGVTWETFKGLVDAINAGFVPYIPNQGTVGASGDLAPLSHMAYSLIGEGWALDPDGDLDVYIPSKEALAKLGLKPLQLRAKEGLALTNGTQFMTAHTAVALIQAMRVMELSHYVAAMSIEALHGTHKAFDRRIHDAKPHWGQRHVAKRIRRILLNGTDLPENASEIFKKYSTGLVQDAYSLRCIPQIHGVVAQILRSVEEIVTVEMNSSNDNPLIFDGEVVSGGNFHGMFIASAADQIALAMSYLCNNSERRIERMVNPHLNGFMPAFLIKDAEVGLNNGAMILQYAAAGITAENRALATPGSVHSIPTCMGTEDIVSMGGYPARKAMESAKNACKVYAYEILVGCQALEFTEEKPCPAVEGLRRYVRDVLKIPAFTSDVYFGDYINKILEEIQGYAPFGLITDIV